MTETTPRYNACPLQASEEELPKGVRFVLLAWFQKTFGPDAWGKVTVIIKDGEIRSWEIAKTGTVDDK